MMTSEQIAESIRSKAEFEEFLGHLLQEFRKGADTWENSDLEGFLAGLRGFVGDLEGFYQNRGELVDLDRPNWRMFAQILLAARVYE